MFDDRLKKLRLKKNLSMRQVALALKMPYTTYVSYEKNEREPNSETLILLANFFNCSIDYLIGRSKHIQMLTLNDDEISTNFSEHEQKVIIAYRQKPDMQPAVDKLLGIEADTIPSITAARSKNNDEPIRIENVPDLSKFEPDDSDL